MAKRQKGKEAVGVSFSLGRKKENMMLTNSSCSARTLQKDEVNPRIPRTEMHSYVDGASQGISKVPPHSPSRDLVSGGQESSHISIMLQNV